MSSILQWARSNRLRDAVDFGNDFCNDMSFSWSGLNLVVDLGDSNGYEENTGVVDGTSIARDISSTSEDPKDECGSMSFPDPEPFKDILPDGYQNVERERNKQQIRDPEKSNVKDLQGDYSHCPWPGWGDPLPPQEDDENAFADCAHKGDENQATRKMVTFSKAVTVLGSSTFQEVRETCSFSFSESSDDEMELDTDQVTSNNEGDLIGLSISGISSFILLFTSKPG
jgi:hypothetical protein